jgi:hypothetical protein
MFIHHLLTRCQLKTAGHLVFPFRPIPPPIWTAHHDKCYAESNRPRNLRTIDFHLKKKEKDTVIPVTDLGVP